MATTDGVDEMGEAQSVPPGIDVAPVTDWLVANIEGTAAPFTFELIAGGRSNLTYRVTDATGRRLVLRRPPLSHVLASAHDMGREHRIISALRDTPVPVPTALGMCTDTYVNGAPFYVMDFVEGSILTSPSLVDAKFDEAARRTIAEDLVDVMVEIHAVDIDAVGLGDLARREGYIARQLKRWSGQFEASQQQQRDTGIEVSDYGLPATYELLAARIPEQGPAAIAHADYRIDNTMIGDDAHVAAVLDWELCTLGDPLADVGAFIMYWHDPHHPQPVVDTFSVTSMPGFPTREELIARYAERSGRDLSSLPYYLAFAHWRMACIMDGVRARFAAGAMGDAESDADADLVTSITTAADRAAAALADL
ncbi:MAG: phosphotransferase family protein [Acidimicrobiia bacterium]